MPNGVCQHDIQVFSPCCKEGNCYAICVKCEEWDIACSRAYNTLEQRAPLFLTKHFGRDLLEVLSIVFQNGHQPVLSLDDEGTLELEVRLNPTEILLLSVTYEGMTDAVVHNARGGYESIASTDMAGVVRFLRESRKVSQVKAH